MHIIDKQTLEIVKPLNSSPEKTAAHVEFDKEAKRALLSIGNMDGELIVYDAKSLKEIKCQPMNKCRANITFIIK